MNWKRRKGAETLRIAVLSDIHGNLEALKSVKDDLETQNIDQVICLGDNVGYGPDPESVVSLIREEEYRSVLGNHEFALRDERGRRWLNFQAAENNEATQELLSSENMQYSCSLPGYIEVDGAHFVHGYPKDNVFRYLNRQPDATLLKLFESSHAKLFFIGHTHKLQMITAIKGEVVRGKLEICALDLHSEQKYIFNCGSVGQPRDTDNRAKYLIWDSERQSVEVRAVEYNYKKTMKKIEQRGFPKAYAFRLQKK
jgi:predicted phosphodiesterase